MHVTAENENVNEPSVGHTQTDTGLQLDSGIASGSRLTFIRDCEPTLNVVILD